MATTLESVTAKIIKAVPDIENSWHNPHEGVPLCQQFNSESGTLVRPITLEDVLQALTRKGVQNYCVDLDGKIWSLGGMGFEKKMCAWALGKPLSEQSEETLAFLDSIL